MTHTNESPVFPGRFSLLYGCRLIRKRVFNLSIVVSTLRLHEFFRNFKDSQYSRKSLIYTLGPGGLEPPTNGL
jgi:hypothetical protein